MPTYYYQEHQANGTKFIVRNEYESRALFLKHMLWLKTTFHHEFTEIPAKCLKRYRPRVFKQLNAKARTYDWVKLDAYYDVNHD